MSRQSEIEFRVVLQPHEVLSRVRETVDRRVLQGRVKERGFWVQLRPRGRNSFARVLRATVESDGLVTVIRAEIGMHSFVYAFMAVWFGSLLGGLIVRLWKDPRPEAIRGLVLMLAFGVMLVMAGWFSSRGDEIRLVQWLHDLFRDELVDVGDSSRGG